MQFMELYTEFIGIWIIGRFFIYSIFVGAATELNTFFKARNPFPLFSRILRLAREDLGCTHILFSRAYSGIFDI